MSGGALRDYTVRGVHARYFTVDKARHKDALKLLAFWDARPADGIVMGRDVPSRAIADLLSHISVLEPTPERTDFRVRLAGASLLKRHGCDVKDRMLSQLFPPGEFQDHLKSGLATIDSDRPLIVDSNLMDGGVTKMQVEVVLLPIVAPDRKTRWVLSGMFYFG